jgi:hypothetical protein
MKPDLQDSFANRVRPSSYFLKCKAGNQNSCRISELLFNRVSSSRGSSLAPEDLGRSVRIADLQVCHRSTARAHSTGATVSKMFRSERNMMQWGLARLADNTTPATIIVGSFSGTILALHENALWKVDRKQTAARVLVEAPTQRVRGKRGSDRRRGDRDGRRAGGGLVAVLISASRGLA